MGIGSVSFFAYVVGYAIGSVPTAAWIARWRGVDLRQGGSGNPGANNARQLGGIVLAAAVLIVEMGKGLAAVAAGAALAGDAGAIAAGLGAVAGNVYNVWYRFQGGKGLGMAAGVILAVWPAALPILVVTIGLGALATRSSGMASLIALGVAVVSSIIWWLAEWPNAWGLPVAYLPVAAVVISVTISPRHFYDARGHSERAPV